MILATDVGSTVWGDITKQHGYVFHIQYVWGTQCMICKAFLEIIQQRRVGLKLNVRITSGNTNSSLVYRVNVCFKRFFFGNVFATKCDFRLALWVLTPFRCIAGGELLLEMAKNWVENRLNVFLFIAAILFIPTAIKSFVIASLMNHN